jgi:cytochrome c biogenesis protein
VVLLLTIAVASIAGTLIPQNQSPEEYIAAFGEPLYRTFYTLDMFDMYYSWWFQALLLLLTLNIVVCSMDRFPKTWKVVFPGERAKNPARFRNLMNRVVFESVLSLEALKTHCRKLVSGERDDGIHETAEGFYILKEKGRWTRFGVYAVHLSVILLLIGALIGSIFGFDASVNIMEGESVSAVRLRNSGYLQKLDFELRCDDFDVSYYPTGAPNEYRSSLTVLEGDVAVLQKDIIVNDPLRYKGINVFQSSFGELPPDQAVLSFTSSATGKEYTREVEVGMPIGLPENLGIFLLKGYLDAGNFRGQNVGGTFVAELTPDNGETEDILLPLKFPTFDKMRKGNVVIAVSDYEPRYYTGLQVTRDPGVWVVYSGFMMLIIGCFITFFTAHQHLFVEVVQQNGKYRVTVSGSANKNKLGMKEEVRRVAELLA